MFSAIYHDSKKPDIPEQYRIQVVSTLVFLARKQISLERAAFKDIFLETIY